MQAKDFTHVSDDVQIAYSAGRSALGEWNHWNGRWHFMGWLYEGSVRSIGDARDMTAEYLRIGGVTA